MAADDDKPIHYQFDLDRQLETCVQEYEEEREQYWQGRTEGADWGVKGLFGHAEAVAESLLCNADDLVDHQSLAGHPEQFTKEQTGFLTHMAEEGHQLLERLKGEIPPEVHRALLRYFRDAASANRPGKDSPLLKLVWEHLCVTLAWDAVGKRLVTGANRILQLVPLVVKGTPAPATLRFLRRVSRCFIWGFDAECVILCRGVIDTAFADAVSDAICDKHGLPRTRIGHTLANRIKAARLESIIDDDIRKSAFRVNTPATAAIHRSPDEDVDVLAVIKDTIAVVQQLVAGRTQ